MHRRLPDHALQLGVDMARMLRLDLLGLFIERTELLGLAALPFAREIGAPEGNWRPLETERLLHDLRIEASISERRFTAALANADLAWRFEVVRGHAAGTVGAYAGSGDIVMLSEPASPAERALAPFSALAQAAFRSPAAVLVVPHRLVRRGGPVAAIASREDDPAVTAAAVVASLLHEQFVILAPEGLHPRVRALPGRTPREDTLAAPETSAAAFGSLGEGLLVISRGSLDEAAAVTIAAARGVPVLVVEPE
jgi:hypothetical protein